MDNYNEIAFFDLDNTLWYIDQKVWIIKKSDPSKPIMNISNIEFALIKNGVYLKDEIEVEFNGEKFYISEDLMDRINRRSPGLKSDDIGISYAEYFDDDILNKKDVTLLLDNIKHLIGRNVEIGLLTARSDRKKHEKLLNKLRLKLKEYGLEISKIYFVSDRIFYGGTTDKIAYDKNKVLLEHLIGLEIEDNKFLPIKKDWYQRVYFYDDVRQNILSSNDMQSYFDDLLTNSEDEVVKFIRNRVNNNSILLINNLITNNELNPFETKIVKLRLPVKYPIKVEGMTTKFDSFYNNNLRY